jgi:hypothetical protein
MLFRHQNIITKYEGVRPSQTSLSHSTSTRENFTIASHILRRITQRWDSKGTK